MLEDFRMPVPRSFFLDGTVSSELLELFRAFQSCCLCPVKRRILVEISFTIYFQSLSLTFKLILEEVSIPGFQDSSSRRVSLVKDVLLDSASNFTVFWESLPDSDLLRIPGDDLQKYHQMIQAAKHTLSLTCSRSFFLDGTFRARDDFCSLLGLLVPVWAGASNHRIPAKRQIIFQIELSENSVENARKAADFGIELSENFNR